MQARATSFETASEDLLPKSMSRWENDREVLEAQCVSLFCVPSASRKLRKRHLSNRESSRWFPVGTQ